MIFRRSFSFSIAAFVLHLSAVWGLAQQPSPAPPDSAISVDPSGNIVVAPERITIDPAVPVAPDPAPDADPDSKPITVERSIYVPFEDLEKIFEDDGRGVFLPYREFLELWNQLNLKEDEEEAKPPTDGVVKSATYTAGVEGEDDAQIVAIDAKLEVESFKDDGWAKVPLRVHGMSLAEAETGEAKLHLGEKELELLLPKPGVYPIELRQLAKVQRKDGERLVKLQFPRAPVSRFQMTVPGQGWEFALDAGIAYTARPVGADTQLEFFFSNRDSAEVRWSRESEETRLEPLIFVDSSLTSRVIPGAVQTSAQLSYRIMRAGVETFEIQVPAPHEVLAVDGANLKEWTVTPQGTLRVSLHTPAKYDYALKLSLEAPLETLPANLEAPAIQVTNAARQSGSVHLTAADELNVEIAETEGLTQQATDAANDQTGTNLGKFRFLRAPYRMALQVAKAAPVVEVESFTTATVEPDQTNIFSRFQFEIKRVGIFETAIQIPAGFEGVEVTGEGIEDFTANGQTVTVRFAGQQLGSLPFQLSARAPRAQEDEALSVPVFEIPGAARHDAKVGLAIHTSLEPATSRMGGLRVEEVRTLGGIGVENPALTPLTLAFGYRGQAAPAQVTFRLKDPQVSATVRTLADIREQVLRYRWWIDYDILYAGVDRLVLQIPADIADDLRIDPASRHKEVDKAYQVADAPDGVVHWAVRLLDKHLGDFQLRLTLDVPVEGLDFGAPIQVSPPQIALAEVFRETGEIAVVKGANLELGEAQTEGLEAIDPRELGGELQSRGNVLLAYKYRRHPWSLTVPVSKNQFVEVPSIVVTYADVTSVVSSDGAITTEMIYWLRNNAESSLKVELPAGARIISDVFVDLASQQPMSQTGSAEVMIRLPASNDTRNRAFPVRFVYEQPSPHPDKALNSRGQHQIRVARLTNAGVLQTRLNLYLPPDFRYTSFDGPMQRRVKARGWRDLRNALDFLVPALGPRLDVGAVSDWQAPPQLPGNAGAGFSVPIAKEGAQFTLHRLDRPADVTVAYVGDGVSAGLEAILCLLAFGIGVLLTGRGLKAKFAYLIFVGLLSLVVAGVVAPNFASVYQAIFLGVLLAVGVWLIAGIWWLVKDEGYAERVAAKPKPARNGPDIVKGPPIETKPNPRAPKESADEPDAAPEPPKSAKPEPKSTAKLKLDLPDDDES